MAECTRADERIRWLAGFPDMNPNPTAGMDAHGVITFASPATEKTVKDPGVFENTLLFVPGNDEEIVHRQKESTGYQIYRGITRNTANVPENIARIRELPEVN